MKIQSLLFILPIILFSACGQKQTKEPAVLMTRSADSVKADWLKPHVAVLRVHLEGEEPTLIVDGLMISANDEASVLFQNRLDQMMTHPYQRDFVVDPKEGPVKLYVTVNAEGQQLVTSTILPRIEKDTRTQVNLSLSPGSLRIVSSWIEECTSGAEESKHSLDTVRIGCYLNEDGTVTQSCTPTSIAWVTETDGRHGKAVALSDADREWVFSSMGTSTGLTFQTLDGSSREGSLLRRPAERDSVSFVFYSDSLSYSDECAFSQKDGYKLCKELHLKTIKGEYENNDMLEAVPLSEGCYIPSVSEMTMLYYQLMGY